MFVGTDVFKVRVATTERDSCVAGFDDEVDVCYCGGKGTETSEHVSWEPCEGIIRWEGE